MEATEIATGIHPGMPADEYHRLPYCSQSALNKFKRSPAHACEAMHTKDVSSPDKIFGTAGHLAVLEPEFFRARYTIADQCAATTKKGERCSKMGSSRYDGQWFCGQHAPDHVSDGVDVLSQDDFDKGLAIAESVQRHSYAATILKCRTDTELSAVWRDPVTDVLSKMRADIFCGNHSAIADLKTTRDARRPQFERAIFDYGYYLQAAFYVDGLSIAMSSRVDDFIFICVEKDPPYAVAVYRMKDDLIDRGRDEIVTLLPKWKQCSESGIWPAYGENIEEIGVPAWAEKQLIDRIG